MYYENILYYNADIHTQKFVNPVLKPQTQNLKIFIPKPKTQKFLNPNSKPQTQKYL